MTFSKIGVYKHIAIGILLFAIIIQPPVYFAMPNIYACLKADGRQSLVVRRDELGLYYRDGMNKIRITLIGKNPYFQISECLWNNKFLVEGAFQEDLIAYHNEKIFKVDSWNFVFPMRREYNLTYGNHYRFFYPLFYLDQYDVENGDFEEIKETEKVISSYEADFLRHERSENYYIVTPTVSEDGIEWHIADGEISMRTNLQESIRDKSVRLAGHSLPEDVLNEEIFFNGMVHRHINFFLVEGTLSDDEIQVSSWKIISPFQLKAESRYFYYLHDACFR